MQSLTNTNTRVEDRLITRETLVLGGTGKTGSRVARSLTALGVPVRIGSRSANPPFDWQQEDTWLPAIEGMKAVYLNYYPDLVMPGAVDAIAKMVDLLTGQGVEKVVLLTGRREAEAEAAERIVQQSELDWTIVRAGWFSQNFSENFLLDPVREGVVALPSGHVPEPFVDADDIAEVIVAALTNDNHARELYEVTGPRLLTLADAVGEIAAASGREIQFMDISPEAYQAALTDAGVPADYVWLVGYLFTTVLDGRNSNLADGVQRALGRPPKDFADYARETAATGIWNAG